MVSVGEHAVKWTDLILLGLSMAAVGCRAGAPAWQAVYTPSVEPGGETVIYSYDFEEGRTDGWSGTITHEHPRRGSRFALKVSGPRARASRDVTVRITEETVLEFDVYTEDAPRLNIQCHNQTRRENCKSYWFLYPGRDFGRWVRVRLPLAGTLTDCASNHAWTAQPGDVLDKVEIHLMHGGTILVDNIRIWSRAARGKVEQARRLLASFEVEQERSARLRALSAENAKLLERPRLNWAEARAHYSEVVRAVKPHEYVRTYLAAAAKAFGKHPDLAIGAEHPLVRISDRHWKYPFRGWVAGAVKLSSARNEYESFQAVIVPLGKRLKGVNVRFSDLKLTGGDDSISAANLTWRTQPYVQPLPCYGYQGYDLIAPKPDPLLPGKPFNLPAHRLKPLWITVYTPPDAPAGEYQGAMTVTARGCRPHRLAIRLRVWDYAIPRTGRFRCQTHMNMRPVEKFYGRKFDQAWRRQWYAFLLRYRFSPTQQYSRAFSPHTDDIEFCKRRGCNVWILGGLSGKKDVPVDEFRKRYEIAKKHGILPYCHVYIGDETSNFALMRRKANILHANFPGLKVMIGGSRPRKELIGYIDIWDPIIDTNRLYGFSPEEMRKARGRGEEVMWYVASSPQHPYPNVHIGDPAYAARILFWLTWKYGITGFEYYCFGLWGRNPRITPRWPKSPWHCYSFATTNGDGQLCYPGPNGQPAASIRLENIRDGIEDGEALWILDAALSALNEQVATAGIKKTSRVKLPDGESTVGDLLQRASRAVRIDDSFCKDVTHWSLDPGGLFRRRREVGELIEAIASVVGKERLATFQNARVAARRALEARRLEQNRQRALKELREKR